MCRSVLLQAAGAITLADLLTLLILLQKLVAEAEKCKDSGNALYKRSEYEAAAVSYLISTSHIFRPSQLCSWLLDTIKGPAGKVWGWSDDCS